MKKSNKTKKTAGMFERVTPLFRKNKRPNNVVSSKDSFTDFSDCPCPLYGPPPWMKEEMNESEDTLSHKEK